MRYSPGYYVFLLASFLSCNSGEQPVDTTGTGSKNGVDSLEAVREEPQPKENIAEADTRSFEGVFSQFFQALQAGDTVALNQFIDPEQGFWLIEQPGAVPAYTHYQEIQEAERSYRNKPLVSVNIEMQQCDLQEREQLPEFDCALMGQGGSGYTANGCFYITPSSFRNSDMWKYANLSEQQANQVQELQQQVDVTVLHTASSSRFHFAYNKDRWQLLFADLRVPCSA